MKSFTLNIDNMPLKKLMRKQLNCQYIIHVTVIVIHVTVVKTIQFKLKDSLKARTNQPYLFV